MSTAVSSPFDVPASALYTARKHLHRYALWLTRGERDLVSAEEACSAADLGLVTAWSRFEPERGTPLVTFARRWVLGAVRRLVRQEVRARRVGDEVPPVAGAVPRPAAAPDAGCLARQLLGELAPEEADVVVEHGVGRTSLAELARERGRHRAWAARKRGRAIARLRRFA